MQHLNHASTALLHGIARRSINHQVFKGRRSRPARAGICTMLQLPVEIAFASVVLKQKLPRRLSRREQALTPVVRPPPHWRLRKAPRMLRAVLKLRLKTRQLTSVKRIDPANARWRFSHEACLDRLRAAKLDRSRAAKLDRMCVAGSARKGAGRPLGSECVKQRSTCQGNRYGRDPWCARDPWLI